MHKQRLLMLQNLYVLRFGLTRPRKESKTAFAKSRMDPSVCCMRQIGRSAGGRVTNVTELKPSNFTS